jgi:ParB-like chromosome segregation protein Spo0J
MTNKLAIKYKATEELIPYALNSRTHSESQVAQLAASIREFGFTNPVLLDGENGILAGHGRVMAARLLKLDTVPTIEISHLTATQKKAYVIADNKLALNAGWDMDILGLEIEELKNCDFEIELLGFDESELVKSAIDYSVLDDEDVDEKIQDMADGVKKAIQIEFEPEHYEEAQELVRYWRGQNAYIGYMILDFLRKQKSKV